MYILPILSGILFTLVFFPFYIAPLAFVALAPLFYFSTDQKKSLREVFFGGCVMGFISGLPLVYFSLMQLRLLPEALVFSYTIRASSILAVVLMVVLFGGMVVVYRSLRTGSALFNGVLGASLFLGIESLLFLLYSGYYLGSFAHAAISFPGIMALASVGGTLFVSFFLALVSCLTAEAWAAPSRRVIDFGLPALLVVSVLALGALQTYFPKEEEKHLLSVALIQEGFQKPSFGEIRGGKFVNLELGRLIAEVSRESDLVVYPFSPVDGAVYKEEATAPPGLLLKASDLEIGRWLYTLAPKTTVLFWNTMVEGENIFDEYTLWREGIESEYRKRVLHPLSDYAPFWARLLGLQAFSYTTRAGERDNRPLVGGLGVGGLICSELHQSSLVWEEAKRSELLIAVGSDTMFPGDLAGNFSLAAARLRAAENGVVVIRANLQGPSAVIDPDGSIYASLAYGERGTLRTAVTSRRISTLYSHTGPAPVYLVTILSLLLGVFFRIRPDIRFLRRRV